MQKIFNITRNQKRFLLLKNISTANNVVPIILDLRGVLNIQNLELSIQKIIERHESLRTHYKKNKNLEYEQVISDKLIYKLEIEKNVDLMRSEEYINTRFDRRFDDNALILFDIFLIQVSKNYYRLCCLFDHSIFDGKSKIVFIEDLSEIYNALLEKRDINLKKNKQSKELINTNKSDIIKNLKYWELKLKNKTETLELQSDFKRPSEFSYNGDFCLLDLSKELFTKIKKISVDNNVSVFTSICTALNIFLYKQSNQENINIGFVSNGRKEIPEHENAIGCYINNIVLNTKVKEDCVFSELLTKVKSNFVDAMNHENVSFSDIVNILNISMDRSRNPIFQIMFNWYPQLSMPHFLDLEVKDIIPLHESHFDLTLYGFRKKDGVLFRLNYNTDLFSKERAIEYLNQFKLVLEQIVENPLRLIGDYSLLTESARTVIPDRSMKLNSIINESVLDFVDRAILKNKENMAIIDSYGKWSYSNLNTSVKKITEVMFDIGIRSKDLVVVFTGRNALIPISIMAILKSGAKFVIIDPEYPQVKIRKMIEKCSPKLVIVSEKTESIYKEIQLEYDNYLLPNTSKKIDEISTNSLPPDFLKVDHNQDAYILFTSGSTGIPKGVINTIRPLSHFINWYISRYGFSEKERFSMISGLSHDPLLRDIFTPLSSNGTLIIPPNDIIESPDKLLDWIFYNEITIMHLTPAHIKIILMNKDCDKKLIFIKHFFIGGDFLTGSLVEEIHEVNGNIRVTNFYGTTETPQVMSFKEVVDEKFVNVSIGKGRDDCQILIINNDKDCGIGQVGEITVRSPYLSNGYVDDKKSTEEKFVVNDLTGDDNDIMYKTGDIGRYFLNGDIEYIGRNDDQVKINGVRIELKEIESEIKKNDNILEVIVLANTTGLNEKELAAYYVVKNGQSLCWEDLSNYLKQKLPRIKIPSFIICLDKLPLNPNGKVDRNALPKPYRQEKNRTNYEPLTTMESKLIEFYEDILQILNIDKYDDFFHLGGNSLKAIQLVLKIKNEINFDISLGTIFQESTIKGLGQLIDNQSLSQSKVLEILRKDGRKTPVCYVGSTIIARKCIEFWDVDRPLYALNILLGGEIYSNYANYSIKDLAKKYTNELLEQSPDTPFYIFSYCLDQVLAYEICHELNRRYKSVLGIILVDFPRLGRNEIRAGIKKNKITYNINKIVIIFNKIINKYTGDTTIYHNDDSVGFYKYFYTPSCREYSSETIECNVLMFNSLEFKFLKLPDFLKFKKTITNYNMPYLHLSMYRSKKSLKKIIDITVKYIENKVS